MIAARKDGGDFWILRPKKKTAEKHSAETINEGGTHAAAFLEAGFPRDFASFQRDFDIREVRPNANPSYVDIEVKFRNRRIASKVHKMIFYVDTKQHLLRGFKLELKDNSEIFCQFSNMRTGVSIPSGTFDVNTAGYKIEEKR